MTSPFVAYDQVAGRYDAGRSPDAAILDRWRAAALARVPAGGAGRVLDVGAGTGLFAAAWATWGAEVVVAVEPSRAMQAQAAVRAGPRVVIVAAAGDRLPVATASIDVAWMSTVLHHLPDLDMAATEVGRVLRPGGRLLVRGWFPDRGAVPWLERFPGAARAASRFPETGPVVTAFARAGLVPVDLLDIAATAPVRGADAARWVRSMRHADSLLTALTDAEIDAGVAELLRVPDVDLGPVVLTLLTCEVPVA